MPLIKIRTILASLLLLCSLLIGGLGSAVSFAAQQPIPGDSVGYAANCTSANCILVCNDGTIYDYSPDGGSGSSTTNDPDSICSPNSGAQLTINKNTSCKSTAKDGSCDANYCDAKNCVVYCDNSKATYEVIAIDKNNYTPDPVDFCKSKGGVAIIINKDGSVAKNGGSQNNPGKGDDSKKSKNGSGGSGSGTNPATCDPSNTESVKCACTDPSASTVCNDPASSGCSSGDNNCDFVKQYINPAIQLFSVAFGLVAVISLIIAGINYSTSEGDPQKSSRAKGRITNTIIAIVAYLFLYSFLQFIVPGGLFNRNF